MSEKLPLSRFLQTLDIVSREGKHLVYGWGRLYSHPINVDWVRGREFAEQLDAFVSYFGRIVLAETPGGQIEMFGRAENLEVVENVTMAEGTQK